MNTRHFCTYFDHNYLPRGMVMLESLHEHCPHAHIYVLCLTDECRNAMLELAYPYVSLISLAELESADPELAVSRTNRSLIEYYFTITPCLPYFLLSHLNLSEITYLDADMLFFSSPEPIFKEAEESSTIITPHKFSAHLTELSKYGLYNVSWMTFRGTTDGLSCLRWYRESCLKMCNDDMKGDHFADQKYLDYFADKFSGVHVIQHNGGGIAPWNIKGLDIKKNEHSILINSEPLIFYHAQSFKHIMGPFYSSGLLDYGSALDSLNKKCILYTYGKKYACAAAKARHYIKKNTFTGIRNKSNNTMPFLHNAKKIVREWLNNTLVVILV